MSFSATDVRDESFDMGRVVSRTFGTIGRNAPAFVALAILMVIPQLVLSLYLGVGIGARAAQIDPTKLLHNYGMMLIVMLVSMIFGAILQAALVHGTVSDLNGKKASFGTCLSTGIGTCLPVIGLSIVLAVGLMLGFILLIVPGVILFLAWSVAVPVLVIEKTGVFATLGRSAELTKGHRWAILGLAVVVWIISFILSMVVLPLTAVLTIANAGMFSTAPAIALSGLINAVIATITATGTAVVYYELRSIKEGIGPEQLASVFD